MTVMDGSGTRLVLMRHAKSDWYSGANDDFSRPLAERGIRDARRMGRWFALGGYLPDAILSSPSQRTRATLDLLGAGAGVALTGRTTWVDALYHSSLETLRDTLRRFPQRGSVMILGHNPGLEEFLRWLVPAADLPRDHGKLFPTGAVYVLDTVGPISEVARGGARVVAHQRPKQLSD